MFKQLNLLFKDMKKEKKTFNTDIKEGTPISVQGFNNLR